MGSQRCYITRCDVISNFECLPVFFPDFFPDFFPNSEIGSGEKTGRRRKESQITYCDVISNFIRLPVFFPA
jgi:hypothetical protein